MTSGEAPRLPQPLPYLVKARLLEGKLNNPQKYYGELGDDTLRYRDVSHETFTVSRDESH